MDGEASSFDSEGGAWTVGSLWHDIAGRQLGDELLGWAPDLFAFTDVVLDRSEAYRFAVSPPEGTSWPPPEMPDWYPAIANASTAWCAWVEGDGTKLPGLVAVYPGAPAGAGVRDRKIPIGHFRGRPAGALRWRDRETVRLRAVEDHIGEREEIRGPLQQLVAGPAPGDVAPQRPYGPGSALRVEGASLTVHGHIPYHYGPDRTR